MPPLDPTQVVTNPQTLAADDAARMEDYWTEARLQSARPMPLPRVYMSRRLREELARRDALAGDSGPIITEPLGPDSPEAVPTAAGFSTQRVNDLTTYPYSVVGKLFMRIGNENYVGSAWVVGERTVFTAGHCVHERQQGWATHVMFRAQYDNGAQAGSFVLPRLATLRGWTQDEDFEFDMALGVSTTPSRG
jgi:V8-like Glu-specific endopeptidase